MPIYRRKINRVNLLMASLALVAASAALLAAPAHAQNLLTNGSFELGNFTGTNPQSAADTIDLAAGSTNITGWKVLSGGGVSDIDWLQPGNPYGIVASGGNRSLDLTGYRDSAPYGGVSQTLTLVQGDSYTLSFDVGCYQSNSSFRGPVAVTVSAGSLNQTYTFTPSAGSTGQQWDTFTTLFLATAPTTTVQFQGASTAGGQYIGLDNAKLTLTGSASAPEPGSLALCLPILCAVVLGMRRRNSRE